jgi:hypothetical protein
MACNRTFTQVIARCRMRYPHCITLPRSSHPFSLQGTECTRQETDVSQRNTPGNATPRPRLTCLTANWVGVSKTRPARLFYAACSHVYKFCIHTKTAQYSRRPCTLFVVTFTHAVREPAHNNGCDPLPKGVEHPTNRANTGSLIAHFVN